MNQQIEEQLLYCKDHENCPYQYVQLKKDCNAKRLLCCECLYSNENKQKWKLELKDLLPISIAIKSPGSMIDTMKNDLSSRFLKGAFNICDSDLEKLFNDQISKFELLEKILKQIKEDLKQQFEGYKKIQLLFQKSREEFLDKIQYNTFISLIQQMKTLDKQFKSDSYSQIESKLSSTIDDMFKDNFASITEQMNQFFSNYNNLKFKFNLPQPGFENYQQQISLLFKQHEGFINNLNGNVISNILNQKPQFKVLTNEGFFQIWLHFKNRIKILINKMNLIYLGSRDGLNAKAFWNKINLKKNLLMIFKSKANWVFGGFSPCQWKEDLNNYVQDDTLASFLFSQTHNQIYMLKKEQKSYAIYCQSQYGPQFGLGYDSDLKIGSDFATSSGYQNLGKSYSNEQQMYKNHFFGSDNPNIIECEIYELIFE